MPATLLILTPESAICRLTELLTAPPLTVTVEGGGVPEAFEFRPEGAVLLGRDEVQRLIELLKKVT